MKNQSALEFMTIISVGLLMLIVASYFGYNYIVNYNQDIASLNARQMSRNIVSAVNFVYSQGVNAKSQITFTVPNYILLNRTFISGREINIRFGNPPSDAYATAAVDIYGAFPTRAGIKEAFIEMTENGAEIRLKDMVSFIKVETYSDAGHKNKADDFTKGNTVYYSVRTEDFEKNPLNILINITVYQPNMTPSTYGQSGLTTDGYLNGSFVIQNSDVNGAWLISALEPTNMIVGTKLFDVS